MPPSSVTISLPQANLSASPWQWECKPLYVQLLHMHCPVVSPMKAPTRSFMSLAMGLTRSLQPGPYSPCGKEDAQSPMDLSAQLFSRSSPQSIPDWTDHAEVTQDQMSSQSIPGTHLPPNDLSAITWEAHRWEKTSSLLNLIPLKHFHCLVIIRALSS